MGRSLKTIGCGPYLGLLTTTGVLGVAVCCVVGVFASVCSGIVCNKDCFAVFGGLPLLGVWEIDLVGDGGAEEGGEGFIVWGLLIGGMKVGKRLGFVCC